MSAAGAQLVGSIAPEEVHVYLLDVAPAGNQPPVPVVTVAPSTPALNVPVTLDASGSHDPDGTVGEITWDFGDGTSATGAVVSHAFGTLGTHDVRVTVRDATGTPATAFVTVSVDVTSLCGAAPAAGCHTAPRDQLTMKMPATARKRQLKWQWKPGAVPAAELGTPSTSDVALCLWDAAGKRLGTGVLASSPGWRAAGNGFRYSDRAGTPGGITTGRIVVSDTAGSLLFKGKGTLLGDVALPLTTPVTVQLVPPGACWTSTWTGAAVTRNDADSFKSRH